MEDPFAAFGAVRRPSAAQQPAAAPANVPMNQMTAAAPAPQNFNQQMPAQNFGQPNLAAPPAYGGFGQQAAPPSYGGNFGMQQQQQMQQQMQQQQQQQQQMQQQQMMMPQQTLMPTPAAHVQAAPQIDVNSLEASLGLAPAQPQAADPFAPQPTAAADPFAPTPADPFAPQSGSADPFAPTSAADPFASSNAANDPFSNPAPPDLSDPFSNPVAPPPPPAAAAAEEEEEDDEEPVGAPSEVGLNPDDGKTAKAAPTVLSRQDTFRYLEELATGSVTVKVDAARALKSLAFNANAEYKEGLLKGGVPRLLMMMINEAASPASLEQATSCMYSMAREHMESKVALVKAGALRVLSTTLLSHDSKQCQLNSCATLYAISCAGRDVCKQLAAFRPLDRLRILVNPGAGRSAQDDQLQLFAALLIVNLLHVKGITSGDERAALRDSLTRAYDDATESQVRETIGVGLKRLTSMGSRKSRLKTGVASGLTSMASMSLSRKSKSSGPPPSASHLGGGNGGGSSYGGGNGGYGGGGGSGMQGFGSAGSAAPSGVSAGRSRSASLAKGALGSVKGLAGSVKGLSIGSKKSGYQGSDSPAHWE